MSSSLSFLFPFFFNIFSFFLSSFLGYPWTEEMVAVAWKHKNVYIDTSAYDPKAFFLSFLFLFLFLSFFLSFVLVSPFAPDLCLFFLCFLFLILVFLFSRFLLSYFLFFLFFFSSFPPVFSIP